MRYPVVAKKDPRIMQPERASMSDDWAASTSAISTNDAQTLVAVTRLLCPHEWLENSVYRAVVLAIDRQAATDRLLRKLLADGLPELHTRGFDAASKSERVTILQSIQETAFFRALLTLVVRHLYDDPIVWAGCGYEGVHGCSDAGQRAGINDLDWLHGADAPLREEAVR